MEIEEQMLVALRRIARGMELQSRHLVRCNGLTGPQSILLSELSKTGEITVGKLAERLSVSHATVTDIVRRLESRGLLLRRRSSSDGRVVNVLLTDQGAAMVRRSPPLLKESFLRLFQELAEWEKLQLVSSLCRIAMMMEAESVQAGPPLASDDAGPEGNHRSLSKGRLFNQHPTSRN